MSPTSSHQKRSPVHLPTPKDLARIFKKPRRDRPELLETYVQSHFLDLPPVPPRGEHMPAIAHSVPRDAVPIMKSPYRVSDFFADYHPKLGREAQRQFVASIKCYPPPRPPFLASEESIMQPGVMVPFVYPPIPALRHDILANMPEVSGKKNSDGKADSMYPVMAPLPFPPPNYMPYPLVSDKAPPTPHEVFKKWLDASESLPRVDMVVASAAGSILDMHAEADAAGLTETKLQEIVRLGQLAESDPETYDENTDISDSSETSESSFQNYMEYYGNIDVSSKHDKYATKIRDDIVIVDSTTKHDYLNVSTIDTKDGEVLRAEPSYHLPSSLTMEADTLEVNKPASLPILATSESVTRADGDLKESRRVALVENYNKLEDHFERNRDQLYAHRKQQLLKKLKNLQASEIHFDGRRTKIFDEELKSFHDRRQTANDEQLLSLKLSSNYEKLKTVLNFYQTSHRSYKTMNLVMINKLQKLKNFLDHQKSVLDEHSTPKGSGDADAVNIRNRDIAKFYESFVEQDYSNEIKEVFRAAVAKDDGVDNDDSYNLDPSLFRIVYKGHRHAANVHDFMPLVTRDEFRLITGEAPSKLGPAKDLNSKGKGGRHPIFQSSLYDRVTSGSDTNASDSGLVLKRRPGRRAAPKPTYGEEVAKNSNDAALVAKIMKQFVGPAAASAQELAEDLTSIGIETKWPVK